MKKTLLILACLAAGVANATPAFLEGVDVLGTRGNLVVYQKHCMSARGGDGFVVIRADKEIGCVMNEPTRNRIEWMVSDKVEYVGAFDTTAPVDPISRGVPTRADVARTMRQRTYDQYGRPQKSTAELCAEARAAGGPVTQICAIQRWAQ